MEREYNKNITPLTDILISPGYYYLFTKPKFKKRKNKKKKFVELE